LAYEPTRHGRSCLGLIAAATVGTLFFFGEIIILSGTSRYDAIELFGGLSALLWLSMLLGAGPATVLVGLPIYFALRGRVRATLLLCCVIGAIVGVLPLLAWRAIAGDWAGAAFTWQDIVALASPATAGAAGGAAFWLIAHHELNDVEDRG
jgi:hypothetical protein